MPVIICILFKDQQCDEAFWDVVDL